MNMKKIIMAAAIVFMAISLPIQGYAAEKNTTSGNSVTSSGNSAQPEVKKIEIPKAEAEYIYTGKEIMILPEVHDDYLIEGEQGKNVGTYKVTLTLGSKREWSDGTKEPKELTWKVIPAEITAADPVIEEKSYNGKTDGKVKKITLTDQKGNVYTGKIDTKAVFEKETEGEGIKVTVTLSVPEADKKNVKLLTTSLETKGTIVDKRTNQEVLNDNVKDKTVADLKDTGSKKKEDIRFEIRGTYPEEKINEKLKEKGITSTAQITERMIRVIKENYPQYTGNYYHLYDVSLIYTSDYGKTWNEGNKNNFPSDGYLRISIPTPGQLDPSQYDFTAAHMFTTNDFGKVPGDIELPLVTERTDSNGIHYLDFYVTGLSPIMICWEEEGKIIKDDQQESLSVNDQNQQDTNSSMEDKTNEDNLEEETIPWIKTSVFAAAAILFLVIVIFIAKKIAWG